MANTPNIRFKGFDDDWEEHRLETVSDVRDGTHDSPTYQSEGHPFVTSKNVKNGFVNYEDVQYISDEDFEEINKRSKVDVNDILMGMIGTIGNLALIRTEPDFAIKNVALIKDTKQVSYLYLYQYLQSKNVEKQLFWGMDGGTQKFLALKKIRELNILIPSEDEQLQIGGFLENLDDIITLYQRKFDKIKQLKKFMLQKMFPKSGKLVPEIRFVGFTSDWEQRKLGEIVERVTRKNQGLVSTLPLTISAQYGLIDQNEFFDKRVASKDISSYYLVKKGEFAYNKSTSSDAPWGAIKRLDRYENGVLSTLYIVFAINENTKIDSDYLVTYYDTDLCHKDIREIAAEGARNHGLLNIASSDFFETSLTVPQDIEEQKAIGKYFTKLNILITLHQRKCNQLKEVKRFMLQNIFPKKE